MNENRLRDDLTIRELPEEVQRQLLLNYLSAHKMEYVQNFLRKKGLPYSYLKSDLPKKLTEFLNNQMIQLSELVDLLNSIEGWGKQHVYLYTAPSTLSRQWRNSLQVHQTLRSAGLEDLINKSRPLILPAQPTLSTIEYSEERIRFVWVEQRTSRVRIPDQDRIEPVETINPIGSFQDRVILQAYRMKIARGLVVFEWNFNTNDALLLIQQMPTATKYKMIRSQFENYLKPIFDIDAFDKIRVSRGLSSIEKSQETRRFHMTFQSLDNRGKIAVTSARKENDVFKDDPVIDRARIALADNAAGLLGHFYWVPIAGGLNREVYTQIYGEDDNDQRVGILAEHKEKNIRYVLSRIRHHCV